MVQQVASTYILVLYTRQLLTINLPSFQLISLCLGFGKQFNTVKHKTVYLNGSSRIKLQTLTLSATITTNRSHHQNPKETCRKPGVCMTSQL